MADTINRILPTHNFISTIHEDFPKIGKKSLFDASVNDARYCTYLPSNTDLAALTSIEFNIDETSNQYIDLKSMLIEVKIEIVNGDGARDDVAAANVHFINNILQTIFPTRHVFLNNTSIECEYNGAHLSHLQLLLDGTEHVIANKGRTTEAFPLTTARTNYGDLWSQNLPYPSQKPLSRNSCFSFLGQAPEGPALNNSSVSCLLSAVCL